MNLNILLKGLDRLNKLNNYVNYEFEPKTNIFNQIGKRNTYFDEMKQEFINDINTFGFSPYILQTYKDQKRDPNIKKFIKKEFNYGFTNYVKIRPRNDYIYSSRPHKRIKFKLRNRDNSLISNKLPLNKEKDKKENPIANDNFLKKRLKEIGGHELIFSFEGEKKENDNNNNKNNNDKLKKRNAINNINLINDIFRFNNRKELSKSISKNLSFNNIDIFGNVTKNKANIKVQDINHFFYKNIANDEKKVLTLSKNKYILGNKRLFSSISSSNIFTPSKLNIGNNTTRRLTRTKSTKNLKQENIKNFLLFSKAIPYKYVTLNGFK
jgi:hypothetical protein